MDREQEAVDEMQRTLYANGSAFPEKPQDLPRAARVIVAHVSSGKGDEFTMHTQAYQAMLGALRDEASRIHSEIMTLEWKPGRTTIYADRIANLRRQEAQVIDILCSFDI